MTSLKLPAAACALLLVSSAWAAETALTADNPFLQPSSLPYHLPPFDRIKESDFRPAFEAGMAEQLREVAAIAHNAEAASFDNTVVALERSGATLNRVNIAFSNLTASNTSDALDKIQAEMSPKLAAHNDAIFLDAALYARVNALYEKRKSLNLDAESLRLLERYHTLFVRAGAPLSEAGKAKLRKLNEDLSTLTTQFQQNLLKATSDAAVIVDKASDLDGLSAEDVAAAADAAKARKLDGKWVITLRNTTGQPAITQMKNRALRERIYKASLNRATGGPSDNTQVVAQLVKLRAERATLLGYASHAAYQLEDETAGTTTAVNRMLAQLAPAAEGNARKDAADMQKLIDAETRTAHAKPFRIQPWDWAYYAEKLRKARYDFDETQVRPYFEMEHVIQDGLFYQAHELYGLSFKERKDLPVYESSVRSFEVFDADGSPLGLFLLDYFARDNKQGGAWMNEYVSQSRLTGFKPVVVNNLNLIKPPPGQPVLLSFDEVKTAFHEFGHAMHGMFSSVQYPLFAGTNVPSDYVEFPSQYNEMWASDPKVFAHYARHYQTGAPMPQALVDKVQAAGKFNEGFATAEYLAAALLDQAWHQLAPGQTPAAKDVLAFEAAALKQAGVDWYAIPPRYRSPYFAHIFAGQYSAGYYAYIWSDVLAKDTQHWFETHGGLSRANGDYLRAKVLSKGFSMDCVTAFTEFYGEVPDVKPLLEHRGLTLAKKSH